MSSLTSSRGSSAGLPRDAACLLKEVGVGLVSANQVSSRSADSELSQLLLVLELDEDYCLIREISTSPPLCASEDRAVPSRLFPLCRQAGIRTREQLGHFTRTMIFPPPVLRFAPQPIINAEGRSVKRLDHGIRELIEIVGP